MSKLTELTAHIVANHTKKTVMTQEQLLQDMHLIHTALQLMEQGASTEQTRQPEDEPKVPNLTIRQAFKKNEVICLVCGKGGFKTLTRHLRAVHNLKPSQYRKQFDIPSSQKLSAKSVTEARRKIAEERGMAGVLEKARATRMANLEAKKNLPVATTKAGVPAARNKAPTPATITKAHAPAIRKKAPVPVKTEKSKK